MDGSIRVLHVDDEPSFRELTATCLEREHDQFEVTTAVDAQDGLEKLDAGQFDCVVSDYNMPGQNGIEFLATVRESYPDLPFILFTGKGSEEVASEAISAGVTEYLQKQPGTEQYELLSNRISTVVSQYRTELELERQNDLFEKAQDIANVGAWEHDLQTGRSYVTDGVLAIHGLSPTESLPPERSLEYYHREDRARIREAFERAVELGESYDLKARLVREDGQQRWVRTRGEPQSENGEITRIRGTMQDITAQTLRQQKLERENERLEDFAYVVSHDIRNPLQVASSQLQLARETGDVRAFDQIEEAHERIDTIIGDILTLAQQGQQIGDTDTVDMAAIAREAWDTVDTDEGVLKIDANRDIEADPERLRQLFENLFRNAAEHADRQVTVTIGPVEPMLTSTRGPTTNTSGFYVADDGPGISEDRREKVFESGFTTIEDGTGFGLAIVARIADAHGWVARVEDSYDGGARFEFVEVL